MQDTWDTYCISYTGIHRDVNGCTGIYRGYTWDSIGIVLGYYWDTQVCIGDTQGTGTPVNRSSFFVQFSTHEVTCQKKTIIMKMSIEVLYNGTGTPVTHTLCKAVQSGC